MLFGTVRDIWRNCRSASETVQDPSRNGQANAVPEHDPPVDGFFKELVEEATLVPVGTYEGILLSCEYKELRSGRLTYKLLVNSSVRREPIPIYILIFMGTKPLIDASIAFLMHRKVKFKIRWTVFKDQRYMQAELLEVF